MENNRNLSSIISKIRDEGPPGKEGGATPVDAGPEYAASQPASAATPRHPTLRKLLLGLVLPLAVIVGLVFFAGNYRNDGRLAGITSTVQGWLGSAPGPAGGTAMTGGVVAVTGAVNDDVIRTLSEQQLGMMARLDQLTDAVTALSETANKSWADTDTVITGLREEQRVALDALEAKVKALQQQLAGQAGKPDSGVASAVVKPALLAKAVPAKPALQAKAAPAKPALQTKAAPAPATAARDKSDQAVAGEEWVVNVASSSREQAMLELAAKLQEQGIPVERQVLTIEGDLMYRLRVPGFPSSGEARLYAKKLDKEFGLRGPWVSLK